MLINCGSSPVDRRGELSRRLNWRLDLAIACGALLLSSWANFTFAADADELKPQHRTVVTADGLPLHLTYWPSAQNQDAAVVILLHNQDGSRLDYTSFAKKLQEEGYAVVAPDLRGHGQSKGGGQGAATAPEEGESPVKEREKRGGKGGAMDASHLKMDDYKNMVRFDMEAVKEFIFEEHQQQHLNMNKIGIVGAEMGASVAAWFAENDWLKPPHPDGQPGFETPNGQDVRALVLLSPPVKIPGLPLSNKPLATLKLPAFRVAILVAVGKNDKADKGDAKKIYHILATPEKNKDRMYFEEYKTPNRGTKLLSDKLKAEEHILKFLEDNLLKFDSTWRDRQSKIFKKTTK